MQNKKFTKRDLDYIDSYGTVVHLNELDKQFLDQVIEMLGDTREIMVFCTKTFYEKINTLLRKIEIEAKVSLGVFSPLKEAARMRMIDRSFNRGGRNFYVVEVPDATVTVITDSNMILPLEDKEIIAGKMILVHDE